MLRWYPLGHAMALAEAAGLRLLFDPLLDDRHHGGVFEVNPPRTIHREALRPDFIFVTHRHPDHFDLPSLRALAALDPDSVVVTPDALVARTAERLGFHTVRLVAPSTRVELDGVRVLTTPSNANLAPIAPEALEFGVAVEHEGAIVWNEVDTVHTSIAELVNEIARALSGKVMLALMQWCPLLEVEASLAGSIGFPFAAYARLLEQAAAVNAVVVPSSAGARHAAPFEAMNALVYPVDETRVLRDLAARGVRTFPSSVGDAFAVSRAGVEREVSAGASLVTPRRAEPVDFKPLAIPPLRDPNLEGRSEEDLRAIIEPFVRSLRGDRLRWLLEIVYPSTLEAWSISDGEVRRGHDPAWDLRNEVAASMLCDVIEGRRHWGDLLLGGTLRACSRAYDVGPAGLTRARTQPIFLYSALSYSESVERAVEHELSRCSS